MNFNAIVTALTAMVLVPFGNALAVEAKVYAAFPSPTIEAMKAMDDENPPIPTVRVVPPTNNQQSPALTKITQVDKAGGYGPYVTWDIPRIGTTFSFLYYSYWTGTYTFNNGYTIIRVTRNPYYTNYYTNYNTEPVTYNEGSFIPHYFTYRGTAYSFWYYSYYTDTYTFVNGYRTIRVSQDPLNYYWTTDAGLTTDNQNTNTPTQTSADITSDVTLKTVNSPILTQTSNLTLTTSLTLTESLNLTESLTLTESLILTTRLTMSIRSQTQPTTELTNGNNNSSPPPLRGTITDTHSTQNTERFTAIGTGNGPTSSSTSSSTSSQGEANPLRGCSNVNQSGVKFLLLLLLCLIL